MMNIDYVVYCYSCHCSACNGKDVYVGKSKYGTDYRHLGHLKRAKAILSGSSRKNDLRIDYLIARHGIDNSKVRTLLSYQTEEEMNQGEISLIIEQKTDISFGGMNFDIGGKGGRKKGIYVMSDETKSNLSISLKAYYRHHIFSDEEHKCLSAASKKRDENRDLVMKRAKNSAKTKQEKCLKDEVYKINYQKMMLEKAKLGGKSFLNKFTTDSDFKEKYCKKVSDSVTKWCYENPDKVLLRAKNIKQSRLENGLWIEAVRKANDKITDEEWILRAKKGWETRRINMLNKQQKIDNDKDHENND